MNVESNHHKRLPRCARCISIYAIFIRLTVFPICHDCLPPSGLLFSPQRLCGLDKRLFRFISISLLWHLISQMIHRSTCILKNISKKCKPGNPYRNRACFNFTTGSPSLSQTESFCPSTFHLKCAAHLRRLHHNCQEHI